MKNRFALNVFYLASGASIAQVIPLISLPLISRYFSPEFFGEFAMFVSATTILAAIASLGYEAAIVIADDTEVNSLSCLSAILALLISVASGIVLYAFFHWSQLLETLHLARFWFFIPLGALVLSLYNIQLRLMSRDEKFKVLASNQVMVEVFNTAFAVTMGAIQIPFALIASQTGSRFAGNVVLFIRRNPSNYPPASLSGMVAAAKKYRDFPFYSAPRSLLSQLASNINFFLYTSFFTPYVTGLIFFGKKAVQRPVSVVSEAVSTVFYSRIAKSNHEDVKSLYVRLVKRLGAVSILVMLVPILFPQSLFNLIFGSKWEEALTFVRILSIGYSAYFVSGALNYVFNRVRQQHIFLMISIVKTVLMPAVIAVAYHLTRDAMVTVTCVAIYDFIHNWMSVGVAYRLLNVKDLNDDLSVIKT